MKAPIFMLTKPEQRVVVVVMLVLLATALAKHYRDAHLHRPVTAPSAEKKIILSPSPAEED